MAEIGNRTVTDSLFHGFCSKTRKFLHYTVHNTAPIEKRDRQRTDGRTDTRTNKHQILGTLYTKGPKGQKSAKKSAKGKYVNRPTLMMVGEEGRGEIVIPTERIRKGLPINAGVAKELGSIGVPGFGLGGFLSGFGLEF